MLSRGFTSEANKSKRVSILHVHFSPVCPFYFKLYLCHHYMVLLWFSPEIKSLLPSWLRGLVHFNTHVGLLNPTQMQHPLQCLFILSLLLARLETATFLFLGNAGFLRGWWEKLGFYVNETWNTVMWLDVLGSINFYVNETFVWLDMVETINQSNCTGGYMYVYRWHKGVQFYVQEGRPAYGEHRSVYRGLQVCVQEGVCLCILGNRGGAGDGRSVYCGHRGAGLCSLLKIQHRRRWVQGMAGLCTGDTEVQVCAACWRSNTEDGGFTITTHIWASKCDSFTWNFMTSYKLVLLPKCQYFWQL